MSGCRATVWSTNTWDGYPCPNPPKWWVTKRDGRVEAYCGVHVRKYKGNPALVVEAMA
jgi:hypothetical protein